MSTVTVASSRQLPFPLTPLVGREREIEELRDLLPESKVRLLVLTGTGGTGKTRLAIALAEKVSESFSDGVAFVSLAAITDASLVVSAIAQSLGVRETGERSLEVSLITYLQTKHLLLLLDNFEHLVESAPLIANLLAACPDLSVLVTSRCVLHLYGERDYDVAPLALPDDGHPQPLVKLAGIESVRLFIDRAQAARASFTLTLENAASIAAICERLDGLPLAIELAAARVRILSPEALLARLEHRLQALTGGPRDVPERHQTMRNTIAWSYDLLTLDQQALLRQLAVFAGGWTLEAAEAVCDWIQNAIDGISILVDQSLIRQIEQPHGMIRFGMLETIREFAADQLTPDDEELARQRHANYHLDLAETLEQLFEGPEQIAAMDRLEQDHANIRLALAWFAARDDAVSSLRLAGSMWQLWHLRGYLSEGRQQYARLLAIRDNGVPPRVQAKALAGAGALALWQQDYDATASHQEAALGIWRRLPLPDQRGIWVSLAALGDLAFDTGRLTDAQTHYEEMLAISRQVGSSRGVGTSLLLLGRLAYIRGDMDEADARARACATLARDVGDLWILSLAIQNLGTIQLDRGSFSQAEDLLEEALELQRRLGAKRNLVHCQLARAWLELYRSQPDAAIPRIEEALEIAREIGERTLTAYGLGSAGDASRQLGELDRAERQYLEGFTLAQAVSDPRLMVVLIEGISYVHATRGRLELAVSLAAAATRARDALGSPPTDPDRAHNEQPLEYARQLLSPEKFTTAWSNGSTMSLDEVVNHALAFTTDEAVEPSPQSSAVLSKREVEVLRLIAVGKADKAIAVDLSISPYTVMRHVQNILAKLELPSRTAAATWAMRTGLVRSEDPSSPYS